MATKVIVQLPGNRNYAVRIGSGIIAQLGQNVREIERLSSARDVLVITDDNVAPLYLAQEAMKQFVDQFDVGRIKIGIVGFANKSKVWLEATSDREHIIASSGRFIFLLIIDFCVLL